jgi:cobalt-precorrin 5A hydrolase / precorrin-3B C17-methyltransferase
MNTAVIVLGQTSVPLARKIMTALPATLYGLSDRTSGVDINFPNFGDTLRSLFAEGTPIIGICAAGILIRTLAPLLSDKRAEPPVIAVAEDGSAVVPLLGGLNGANDLARLIATALHVNPAITTTGDLRFRTPLLSPPTGYRLANSDEQAKIFLADLLAGATVKLDGTAPWLSNSRLPIADDGALTIQITEQAVAITPDRLVYHPATIAIAVNNTSNEPQQLLTQVQQQLAAANLSVGAVAGIFSTVAEAANPEIHALAQTLGVPARFFRTQSSTTELAMAAVGSSGRLVELTSDMIAIAIATQPIDPNTIGQPQGKLSIIGTGPGGEQWMSPEVKEIIRSSSDLVGYSTYLNLIGSLADGKQCHESDNREELSRARMALDLATEGRDVVVVSSGDPGIYAMASAVFEVIDRDAKAEWSSLAIHVAPGISAMQAAAAAIGAPLGHDFCAISLSDILKPWSAIEQRLTAAAQADFVIAFYNPVSKQRTWQLAAACEILLKWRSGETPVVLAKNLGRPGQAVKTITLAELKPEDADMRTVILIGSSKTRTIQRPAGCWVYTPRTYQD